MVTSVSSRKKHPEFESCPCPEGKEEPGEELSDIRRNPEVVLQSHDNTEIYEVVQPHKDYESNYFIVCLSLACFVTEHPVTVNDKEQEVGTNARDSYSEP